MSKVYAFCHGYFYFYFIFTTDRELVMVLLKCATYVPHCINRCKRETRLSAISTLRNILQAKKGYQVLVILHVFMLNLFIESDIIHHRESCFSSIFNVV